ncbi:hypothetical protein C7C46_13550 [Streptomyces tateyamensis]|uniref:Uncharacterized protein n=1 Tax=Streptomyces tateyamensis TaxID=565073 RepID=A0A2V4NDY0_9ACTN|nr:hypothetical protein [Streptomyces tateyamensis]PYC79974.1 hypothetical protein C7C46_13550 [Streptomyces tateyamensis]
MVMADSALPLSHDAFYLDATARMFGWHVTRESDETLVLRLTDRRLRALFWHDGGFRFARATGPGSGDVELGLREVLDVLEEYGTAQPTQ